MKTNLSANAHVHILSIMNSEPTFKPERIRELLDIIQRNSDYLKKQGLYESILTSIKGLVAKQIDISKKPEDDNEEK